MIHVNIDGACRGNPGICGIGAIAKDGKITVFEISECIGRGTNNIAEYYSLIRALEELLFLGLNKAHFISDSQLLVEQINGNYKVKDEILKMLYLHAKKLINKFKEFSIKHALRQNNSAADNLANRGIDNDLNNSTSLFTF